MLARVRSWLERRGWWYGRLKPCSCPRSDRYWGLATWPSDCERVNDGAERVLEETDAATVVEWRRTITWRCRQCGDCFEQHTGVLVERDVQWHEGTAEACPEVQG